MPARHPVLVGHGAGDDGRLRPLAGAPRPTNPHRSPLTAHQGTRIKKFLDELNHFRGAFLTKTVIDRKMKITLPRADGTVELHGPPWPELHFHVNHICHGFYQSGQGPHLFRVSFQRVQPLSGIDQLMAATMAVESLTTTVPAAPSIANLPVATLTMRGGRRSPSPSARSASPRASAERQQAACRWCARAGSLAPGAWSRPCPPARRGRPGAQVARPRPLGWARAGPGASGGAPHQAQPLRCHRR